MKNSIVNFLTELGRVAVVFVLFLLSTFVFSISSSGMHVAAERLWLQGTAVLFTFYVCRLAFWAGPRFAETKQQDQ